MQLVQHHSFHLFIHNNFETMYYHTVKACDRYITTTTTTTSVKRPFSRQPGYAGTRKANRSGFYWSKG